jgi:hypothetical protein
MQASRAAKLAACAVFLCGAAALVHAQPAPQGGYYPKYLPQPIQPVQNIYYGNYQNNTVPGYIYPRTMPMPPQNYYSGNGITYYYVNNPNGPSHYPFTSPYGTPPAYQAKNRAPTYPAPAYTPPVAPPYTPIDSAEGDGSKPVVQFHRNTDERCWVQGDYVASFIRPMRLGSGPLVTTGSQFDNSPGALSFPATRVLFGDSIDYGLLSGFRLQLGHYLGNDNRFSIDIGGFYSFPSRQSATFMGDANGNPVISRPIFDVVLGTERVFLNSAPGNITGTLTVENRAEIGGVELNARYHGYVRERLHTNVLVGFRYLRLAERLRIEEQINNVAPNFLTFLGVPTNNMLRDEDEIRTVNHFFGPQIGARASWEYGAFNVDGFVKLAVGASRQETNISGSTTLVTPNGNQVANGGILALPSNSGAHRRTVLGIVPELGVNLGVELTQHCRLNLGYSFLMWNHVARPGSQYDRNVNPTQVPGSPTFANLPGPLAPAYRFNDEFFWMHLLNVGLEIHY